MQYRRSILLSIILALLTAASFKSLESQAAPQPSPPKVKLQEAQGNSDKTETARKGHGEDYKQANSEKTINIKTDLVIIDLQVVDQKNQPVFDPIKKEDFTVFEDNDKQEIAHIYAPNLCSVIIQPTINATGLSGQLRVTINTKGKRRLSARTRQGYYAGKDDSN
jgi:hypothetical protein